MIYARVFVRGFVLVALVAANTRQIASGRYVGAFMVGCAISAVWWFNSRCAARSDAPGAGVAYALGAGCGTVAGMFLAG